MLYSSTHVVTVGVKGLIPGLTLYAVYSCHLSAVDVDLNAITQRSCYTLSSKAAMHKCAVRPRGRRVLSAYQPYVSQHEAVRVCVTFMLMNYL